MTKLPTGIAGIPSAQEIVNPTPGALLRRRIFGHAGLIIGGTILTTMLLIAVFADVISPADPYEQMLARKLIPPVLVREREGNMGASPRGLTPWDVTTSPGYSTVHEYRCSLASPPCSFPV